MKSKGKFEEYSLEAEQSVLGGLILSPERFSEVIGILTKSDFYDKRHQILFDSIQSVVDQSKIPDPVTIADNLLKQNKLDDVGGGKYLGLLATNILSAANILTYADMF